MNMRTVLTRKTAVYADTNKTDRCPYADVHKTEMCLYADVYKTD